MNNNYYELIERKGADTLERYYQHDLYRALQTLENITKDPDACRMFENDAFIQRAITAFPAADFVGTLAYEIFELLSHEEYGVETLNAAEEITLACKIAQLEDILALWEQESDYCNLKEFVFRYSAAGSKHYFLGR